MAHTLPNFKALQDEQWAYLDGRNRQERHMASNDADKTWPDVYDVREDGQIVAKEETPKQNVIVITDEDGEVQAVISIRSGQTAEQTFAGWIERSNYALGLPLEERVAGALDFFSYSSHGVDVFPDPQKMAGVPPFE